MLIYATTPGLADRLARGVVGAADMVGAETRGTALEEGAPARMTSRPHRHIMCELGSAVWKRSADKTIAVSLPVFFHQWDTRWFSAIASPALWTRGSSQV